MSTQRPDMMCVPAGSSSVYTFARAFMLSKKSSRFLARSLLGGQSHVFVSLKETLSWLIRMMAQRVHLLES